MNLVFKYLKNDKYLIDKQLVILLSNNKLTMF